LKRRLLFLARGPGRVPHRHVHPVPGIDPEKLAERSLAARRILDCSTCSRAARSSGFLSSRSGIDHALHLRLVIMQLMSVVSPRSRP